MIKKKKMWCVTITILAFAGAVTFYSCQKDQVLDNPKQELVEKPMQKYCRIDYFISAYDGKVYEANAENWALFEQYGGFYWFYDADGKRWGHWPLTGEPYWRPSVGGNDNPPDPSEPSTPPNPPIGKFVRHTIVDIMNAPSHERQNIVIENMLQPFDPGISLSAKIDVLLLEKVVSGEYIISNITENYFVNSTETEVTFEYTIEFLNPETAYITLYTTIFTYEKGDGL